MIRPSVSWCRKRLAEAVKGRETSLRDYQSTVSQFKELSELANLDFTKDISTTGSFSAYEASSLGGSLQKEQLDQLKVATARAKEQLDKLDVVAARLKKIEDNTRDNQFAFQV